MNERMICLGKVRKVQLSGLASEGETEDCSATLDMYSIISSYLSQAGKRRGQT